MRTASPLSPTRLARRLPPVLLVPLLLASGCFNDAFRGHDFGGEGGLGRFELVIEADRTQVDSSHFLVDRATGDVWRLDVGRGDAGTWVRLATGPEDAVAREVLLGLDPDADAD